MRFEGDESPERRYILLSFKPFHWALGGKLTSSFLSDSGSVEQLLMLEACQQCQNLCGQTLTGDL